MTLLQAILFALAASMALPIVRVFKGPVVFDPLFALGTLLIKAVALLMVLAFELGTPEYVLPAASIYALVNWTGVLAPTRYFEITGVEVQRVEKAESRSVTVMGNVLLLTMVALGHMAVVAVFLATWSLGLTLVTLGVAAFFCAGAGLLQMPDVYTRAHVATIVDSFGLFAVMIGLAIYAWPNWLLGGLLIFTAVASLEANAAGAQATGSALFHSNIRPWRAQEKR